MSRHPAALAPSRFTYALPRLLAWLAVRGKARPRTASESLAFYKGQSAIEANTISVLMYALIYVLGTSVAVDASNPKTFLWLAPLLLLPFVFFTSTIIAAAGVITLARRLFRFAVSDNRLQSGIQQFVVAATCCWGTLRLSGVGRIAAASWLVVLAANGLAWMAGLLLRKRMARTDQELRQCVASF
jgi:hypothetical protein